MEAVILSGGLGTRMRPLTYTTPKPLLPLLNKPLVMHIIDSLPERVDEVVLAANYKIDMLREYFEEVEMEREVHVVDEPEPRGTGGAVKNVEDYINDTFFVINGDIVSDIDIGNFLNYHESRGGVGTLSAWKVEDPSEFGVMDLEKGGRIKRFQEKPEVEEAFSNVINAGHYILEPEVLDMIPSDRKVSIEREIFPRLLSDGLFGYEFDGYWIDCGRPESLFEAQRTLLDVMSEKVVIGDSSVEGKLKGHVSVGDECELEGCEVIDSIIFDGVKIGSGSLIKDSILGNDVVVEEDVRIESSIVADGSYVEDGKIIKDKNLKPEEEYL